MERARARGTETETVFIGVQLSFHFFVGKAGDS